MPTATAFPLDLARTGYSYVERPNTVLLSLLRKHVVDRKPFARVLDIGCGAGANLRALGAACPGVRVHGIEPNATAAARARQACERVFGGTTTAWLADNPTDRYDAVVLADVLEHVADPVAFLRELTAYEGLRDATWVVSVPNYAVWYNRVRTLAGRFDYAWSGLYDRTHLRFYTRRSVQDLLRYAELETIDDRCTPSLVQSAAPILRRFFDKDVAEGEHLSLPTSTPYKVYEKVVEPVEATFCGAWPELLGFQIVTVARGRGRSH